MQYIITGCSFSKSCEVLDKDGESYDLSEKKISFILKKNKSDDDLQAVLPRIDFVNSEQNKFNFSYTAEQTKGLSEGIYHCAVKIYGEDGFAKEIWSDQVTVTKGVFNG